MGIRDGEEPERVFFGREGGRQGFAGYVELSADSVSWEDCQKLVEKLNAGGYALAGLKFRLPTEAEWERAPSRNDDVVFLGNDVERR